MRAISSKPTTCSPRFSVREGPLQPGGRLAVRARRAWWEQHRDKAPRLFFEELAVIVAKLRDGTHYERQQYAARGGRIICRALMPSTRHHIYYRVNEPAGEVEILLVWSAIAGATPDF